MGPSIFVESLSTFLIRALLADLTVDLASRLSSRHSGQLDLPTTWLTPTLWRSVWAVETRGAVTIVMGALARSGRSSGTYFSFPKTGTLTLKLSWRPLECEWWLLEWEFECEWWPLEWLEWWSLEWLEWCSFEWWSSESISIVLTFTGLPSVLSYLISTFLESLESLSNLDFLLVFSSLREAAKLTTLNWRGPWWSLCSLWPSFLSPNFTL